MDMELLKTFIEVYQNRHFAKAADTLFVTPAAVSARIRLLESQLGASLFKRERNNIQLTAAGERLLSYAKPMLKLWEQARYEVAADADPAPSLSVLAVPSLWDTVLNGWLKRLCLGMPELALRLESLNSDSILRLLQQNKADLGFMLEPREGPELNLIGLGGMSLVMVSSRVHEGVETALADRYAVVDWGASFFGQHANAFPGAPPPRIWVSTGRLAYDLLLSTGGTAYLPRMMVAPNLRTRRLFLVERAPIIALHVYAAYPAWIEKSALILESLALIKEQMRQAAD
jgi:DNA-binding transcriptional LysR family regulator